MKERSERERERKARECMREATRESGLNIKMRHYAAAHAEREEVEERLR